MDLYEPINTLKMVDDDIWLIDGPIVRMTMYGTAIPFPTRMTIVRLRNGDLWCHSPIELSAALKEKVDALGPVRHLISPNKIHYAHIAAWASAYPQAIAWASPGVRERAMRQNISVKFDADLEDAAPPEWRDDIEQLFFRGSRFMDEVVFFHRSSSTLILADLIENFELHKVDTGLGWLLRAVGAVDPDGKAPLDLRMTFWGRKSEARRCLQRMLNWPTDKVIIAHGRWYTHDGSTELRRAFRWLS